MSVKESVVDRLKQGNQRFIDKTVVNTCNRVSPEEVASAQHPFAIILSCADSRVPPEIIFDQSLGDLFVVRVAGSIALPSQIGSIEFALESFACPVVVVLGHSQCGGVKAALSDSDDALSHSLSTVVGEIKKNLSQANILATDGGVLNDDVDHAVHQNVHQTVSQLANQSEIVARRVAEQQCQVIGASYDLATGSVEFFE